MRGKKNIAKQLGYHAADSTALMASSFAPFALFETQVAGMSNEVSINSKIFAAGLTYLGLGYVVGKSRDVSRTYFGIDDKSTEGAKMLHDSAYMAAINIPLCIGLYTASGETEWQKILTGTATTVGLSAVLGSWMGYCVDVFRDLTGIKPTERHYPQFLKRMNSRGKMLAAAGAIALSFGLTCGVYALNSEKSDESKRKEIVYALPERSRSGDYIRDIIRK